MDRIWPPEYEQMQYLHEQKKVAPVKAETFDSRVPEPERQRAARYLTTSQDNHIRSRAGNRPDEVTPVMDKVRQIVRLRTR
ncbi:hypothetical protein GCM10011385_33140 [Nitratireductor aestuarii]|uniref:Uncharacterized protein n=1 Tax=Nitratireductor aestuarii TaxID=1735103 RepID=A0A916W7Y2_9HYPH|nr:hypothetical protein GCM10011385_33140 [Nitratireductor aestuarii]